MQDHGSYSTIHDLAFKLNPSNDNGSSSFKPVVLRPSTSHVFDPHKWSRKKEVTGHAVTRSRIYHGESVYE